MADDGREQARTAWLSGLQGNLAAGAPLDRPGMLASLGAAAAELKEWLEAACRADRVPSVAPITAAAERFMNGYGELDPPARAELAEISGWCEALRGGWFEYLEPWEFPLLLDEAFAPPDAPWVRSPERVIAPTPAVESGPGAPDYVLRNIALHHVVCAIAALDGHMQSTFEGDLGAGAQTYTDSSEFTIVIGWTAQGVVGFGFNKLGPSEDRRRPKAQRDPLRWLPELPDALRPLATTLSSRMDRLFTSGFYATADVQRVEPDPGADNDASDELERFLLASGAMLPRWCDLRGVPRKLGKLALTLADRAIAGGGEVSAAEGAQLLKLGTDNLDAVRAAFAKVGLRWQAP